MQVNPNRYRASIHSPATITPREPRAARRVSVPGEYVPIPVYLDRPSITEALGDYAATALASAGTTGADVRGGPLTSMTAELAAKIDGYIGLLTYLTRPEALIAHATRPGVTPVKPRRPKQDADIWIVGGA